MAELDEYRHPYPLYNTTYTLHRLSPLHIHSALPLDTAVLQHHARRFRDILVGDVLRGVRIGLENDAITAAGALKTVTWQLLPQEDDWDVIQAAETQLDETTVSIDNSRGIIVSVEYEKSTYTGLLLKGRGEVEDGFQHFPLLMTKMPGSLRGVLLDFLGATFDAHSSLLHLPSKFITESFEQYLLDVGLAEDGEELSIAEGNRSVRNIVKETEVFVGFDLPNSSGALKTMEIHLMREDIPRLLATAKKIGGQAVSSPFTTALTTYIEGQLALDLKHDLIKIVRIACGAFVLGVEGKVKLTEPITGSDTAQQQFRATASLVDGLVVLASGTELEQQTT